MDKWVKWIKWMKGCIWGAGFTMALVTNFSVAHVICWCYFTWFVVNLFDWSDLNEK